MHGDTRHDYWFAFIICSPVFTAAIYGVIVSFQNGFWLWLSVMLVLLFLSTWVLGAVAADAFRVSAIVAWSLLLAIALGAIAYGILPIPR